MRHYEVVLLIHPDQSEQVPAMLDRYRQVMNAHKAIVHRLENWGRRQLAYQIEKVHKAHYLLMNIECDQETLDELNHLFRFNDAVLRSLVIRRDYAITAMSPLAQEANKYQEPVRSEKRRVEVKTTEMDNEEQK